MAAAAGRAGDRDWGGHPRQPVGLTGAVDRDPERLASRLHEIERPVARAGLRAAAHTRARAAVRAGQRLLPGAYRNVNNSPYHVLRILRTGDTAAIELHWLPNVGYSTIVLNRQDGRWRAVDMIPGGHVVPHH